MSEGTPPNGGTPPAPPAPPAPPGASAGPWDGLTPESRTWVTETKGFKGVADLVGAYQNAEKAIGSRVAWPKDDNDADGWNAIYQRMGRPEKPEAYTLEGYKPPEGGIDLMPWFQQTAHKHGLGERQFRGVMGEFLSEMKRIGDAEAAEYAQLVKTQEDAVTKAWGPDAPKMVRNMQVIRKLTGWSEQDATEAMLAMGPEKWSKLATIGNYFAEQSIGDLTQPNGAGGFGMTREAAQARINELTASMDPAVVQFRDRLMRGDPVAAQEWQRLQSLATGQ